MHSAIRFLAIASLLFVAACGGTNPESNPYSNRLVAPSEVVREHLRAIEAGDWKKASSYLAEDFKMKVKGYPLSVSKKNALKYHEAFKEAVPNMAFNEEVLKEDKHVVKLRVRLTGTHLHTLNLPDPGSEPIPGTGKSVNLSYQEIKYYIKFNQIHSIQATSMQGIDPNELVEALSAEQ